MILHLIPGELILSAGEYLKGRRCGFGESGKQHFCFHRGQTYSHPMLAQHISQISCPWALRIHMFSLMETIVIVSVARMGVKYLKNMNSETVSDYASSIFIIGDDFNL